MRLDLADDVPALAAEALRVARRDAPDAARLASIEAAVLQTLTPPNGGGGSGGGGGAAGAGSSGGGLSTLAKAGVALAGGGAAIVAIVLLATRTTPAAAVSHDEPAVATSVAAQVPSAQSSASAERSTPVDDLPAAVEPAPSHVPAQAVSARPPVPEDPAESERAEVALLDRAQASLVARPAETLARCDEHARRFASGTLVQEREVLAIDALLRLGRRNEAEARAARFRTSFPRSGHLRRIDALLRP